MTKYLMQFIELQDPTEKHFCDVGILGKYEVINNNNNNKYS